MFKMVILDLQHINSIIDKSHRPFYSTYIYISRLQSLDGV